MWVVGGGWGGGGGVWGREREIVISEAKDRMSMMMTGEGWVCTYLYRTCHISMLYCDALQATLSWP